MGSWEETQNCSSLLITWYWGHLLSAQPTTADDLSPLWRPVGQESPLKSNDCPLSTCSSQEVGPQAQQTLKGENPLFLTLQISSIQQPSHVAVQLLSHVQLFSISWTAACQASLSFTISWSLLKLTPIESVMPSNHLVLCRPLLFLPSLFPCYSKYFNISQHQGLFQWVSSSHQVAKVLEF